MSEDARRDADDSAETEKSAEQVAEALQQQTAEPADPPETLDSDPDNGAKTATEVDVNISTPSRAPLLLAGLAFLIALLSAAGVGYLWTNQPADVSSQFDQQLQRINSRLDAANAELARTGQSLEQARAASTQSSSEVDGMRRTLDERLRSLEAIPGRLSNLESSLSALQGISSGLRDTWLLSEAEYYLQIANAQLQLAGNAELAIIALALADERLASLGNPALTDVRRKVADERRDLESLRDIDLEGAVLTLGSLADAIQTLPLKNDIKVPVADEQIPTTEQSGMARALASLKSAMSDVISVRRSDEPVTPLLPPDAAYFLRNNLALQMQTARLAMLRGEQTIFEESLADALAWINEYYDTESRAVQSATETISELRDMRLTVSKPDISGSLTALRQYMSLRSEMNRAQPESDQ
ncbi:MAG: uroporphyrinogen-III C-methyltransferase [Woeseia sp.]